MEVSAKRGGERSIVGLKRGEESESEIKWNGERGGEKHGAIGG
jgi:hypothetical protein